MANTATVAGGAVTDPNPGNNSATDTDTLAATSVQFSSATYIEDESQNASIVITRTGDTTGISSVLFSAAAGGGVTGGATCAAGVDFILVTNQLVTFIAGDDEETVSVVICGGDTVQEVGENIALTLSTPTNTGLGTPAAAVLSINDTASQFLQTPPHTPIDMFLGAIANPYPSTITVSGGPMLIGTMRVTLYDVSHAFPDNMDVLLVGPNGQKYLLLADTGGNTAIPTTGHVTLTFSDFAGTHVPDSMPWTTGQFLPTVCDANNSVFAPGAPALPYVTPNCTTPNSSPQSMFGAPGTGFGLTDSNGVWSLYVRDDAGQARPIGDAANFAIGTIAGGWGLQFLVPTASGVSVSGRVTTADGRGIRGAIVTVTGNSLSTPINVATGVNGRYLIEGLTAGETYVVTIRSRRFVFANPSRIFTLNDNVIDADFVADPGTTRIDR